MKQVLIICLAVAAFAACTPKNTPMTKPAGTGGLSVTGTYWKLIELNGQAFKASDMGKPAFLQLAADGKMSASAGCNNMMGTYKLDGPTGISFGPVASTRMACPDMESEQAFSAMLSEVNTYAINGNQLMLAKNRMAPAARFEAAPQPR